jgi:4-hydroxybenzoate polyprenyltransferase
LKELVLIDVFCLAGLYTLRLVSGHAVSDIPYSPWLIAFSAFLFISLAVMKRYVELRALPHDHTPALGRGYIASDGAVMLCMGTASSYLSVLILSLYINSEQVTRLYAHPAALWPICFIILYFLSTIWFQAHRGRIDDDPVLFVWKDKTSYICAALIAAILIAASL